MTTGSEKIKIEEIQETPLFDKVAVTKFADIGGYFHKGKQNHLNIIVITTLIFPSLLGFRCTFFLFFPPQHEIHFNLYIATAWSFELVGMQSQVGLLHIPIATLPLNRFIANLSVAVLQSVWIVYSFNMTDCLLEAKITRCPPFGGEEAAWNIYCWCKTASTRWW